MHGNTGLKDKVYDRLASDLPINAQVAPAIVDDPYDRLAKVRVIRSVRDDPLAGMKARDQIDDAMLAAGRLWQMYLENSEIGGTKAIDFTREAVDGGRFKEPDITRMSIALVELKKADKQLGQEGCALIRDVLGARLTIMQAAHRRSMSTQREIDYLGRRFRECLNTLAILWGFANRP